MYNIFVNISNEVSEWNGIEGNAHQARDVSPRKQHKNAAAQPPPALTETKNLRGGGFFCLLGIIFIFIGGFLRILGIVILFVLALALLLKLDNKAKSPAQRLTRATQTPQPITTPPIHKAPQPKTDRSLKPYKMPRVYGAPLMYEYADVNIFMPNDVDSGLPDIYHALLALRPEPQNPYDENSVAVYYDKYANGKIAKSYRLGYMYSGTLRDMVLDYIESGRNFLAVVEKFDAARRELVIHLGFYYWRDRAQCPVYKLINTAGARTQENIDDYCTEGVEIEVEIGDNGKYAALSSGEHIGYFPARAESVVSDYPLCAVDRIESDENGKQTVYVICFVGTSGEGGRL